MKIVVAGAGAGKTTSMAQVVLDRLKEVNDGKIVYVITYTNAARDRIREKITQLHGNIPKQLFIETVHVFLLREFIFPFHHLLFEEQFTKVSQIKLPDNPQYKAIKIKELSSYKRIHVEKVTETAKWIICGKTRDRKETKENRKKISAIVSRYLDSVFIDEAQDLDKHLVEIIEVLNGRGINMYLVGDPKQDLRGRNAFKEMIFSYKQHVEYISMNNRCPASHVRLANRYISKEEQQRAKQSNKFSKLNYVFESDIDISNFVNAENWDYAFIYNKNERFATHAKDRDISQKNLSYELKSIVKKLDLSENEENKLVYSIKNEFLKDLIKVNNFEIFNKLEKSLSIKLTKQEKGKLGQVLDWNRELPILDGILVNSIDSIKGLEGNRCLFILTTDLTPYLFAEEIEQNKMLNYLYVALTRSKSVLTILVTNEVENKYGRKSIYSKFKELGVEKVEYTKEVEFVH
jgi:thymidine kinase